MLTRIARVAIRSLAHHIQAHGKKTPTCRRDLSRHPPSRQDFRSRGEDPRYRTNDRYELRRQGRCGSLDCSSQEKCGCFHVSRQSHLAKEANKRLKSRAALAKSIDRARQGKHGSNLGAGFGLTSAVQTTLGGAIEAIDAAARRASRSIRNIAFLIASSISGHSHTLPASSAGAGAANDLHLSL